MHAVEPRCICRTGDPAKLAARPGSWLLVPNFPSPFIPRELSCGTAGTEGCVNRRHRSCLGVLGFGCEQQPFGEAALALTCSG